MNGGLEQRLTDALETFKGEGVYCCVRVGMPVEGPARWISNSTAGISAK